MQRIDSAGALSSAPTPAAGVASPGWFNNASPAAGITPVILTADWANAIQDELANVITASGQTLSKTVFTQLLQAVLAVPGKNVQVFTSSGTFTAPANVTRVEVTVVGGGGGSGGSYGSSGTGGGGGAGGTVKGFVTVTPGGNTTVTVGAGGTAGTGGQSGATAGGNGGTSSFGAFLSATGGTGGSQWSIGSAVGGGTGGAGTGGNELNVSGGQGGDGSNTGPLSTAFGGASLFSGGTKGGNNQTGNPGLAFGGGASASYSSVYPTVNGAAGAAGIVIVKW